MMGNGFGMGGMWWVWLWGILVLAGIVFLVVVAASGLRTRASQPPPSGTPFAAQPPALPPRSHARGLLDERYARGELTTDEYQERLGHLAQDA